MTEITIPYRSREDRLVDVAAAAHVLPDPEERQVLRQLVLQAHGSGLRTAADLVDWVEAATPGQRRAMLNEARVAAGLQTIEQMEAIRRWEAAQPSTSALRDHLGRRPAVCCADGCRNVGIDPQTGGPLQTSARRWACPEHEELGDFEDWSGSRLAYSPSGAIVDLDEEEREAAQERERAERRRARREVEQAERVEAAEQAARDKQARRAQLERETPPGFPT